MCKLGGYTHLTEASTNLYPTYNSETQNPQTEVYSGFGDQYSTNIAADLAADQAALSGGQTEAQVLASKAAAASKSANGVSYGAVCCETADCSLGATETNYGTFCSSLAVSTAMRYTFCDFLE